MLAWLKGLTKTSTPGCFVKGTRKPACVTFTTVSYTHLTLPTTPYV